MGSKTNKKTQKVAIIGIALTVISIGIGYNQLQLNVQTNQASIDYRLEKPTKYYKGINAITINCRNGGGMDGDFNLLLTFTNATFSNQTNQPYYQVNNTQVKVRFTLHKSGDAMDSNSKVVFFSVSENVNSFSLSLSLERLNQNACMHAMLD